MKNKIYLLLITFVVISCNKQNKLEEILLTKSNEAWVYYSPKSTDFTYYKFQKNHYSSRYERDNKNKFFKYYGAEDSPEIPEKWVTTKDSILKWGIFAYDVVSYNENVIVMYHKDENSLNQRMVFLIKEKENSIRKNSARFEQKRINYPEKYKIK